MDNEKGKKGEEGSEKNKRKRRWLICVKDPKVKQNDEIQFQLISVMGKVPTASQK